jgi:hypothetical protein
MYQVYWHPLSCKYRFGRLFEEQVLRGGFSWLASTAQLELVWAWPPTQKKEIELPSCRPPPHPIYVHRPLSSQVRVLAAVVWTRVLERRLYRGVRSRPLGLTRPFHNCPFPHSQSTNLKWEARTCSTLTPRSSLAPREHALAECVVSLGSP